MPPIFNTIMGSLFGALVGSLLGFAFQRHKYNIDRLTWSIDTICDEVNKTADIATEYHLTAENSENRAKMEVVAATIVGKQLRIAELLVTLKFQDGDIDLRTIDDLLPDFYDALTGGNFKDSDRAPAPTQAQGTQMIAAQINGSIRRALISRVRDPLRLREPISPV